MLDIYGIMIESDGGNGTHPMNEKRTSDKTPIYAPNFNVGAVWI